MAVLGDEPRHPPPSEPRAQAVDQAVELGLILVAAETDLLVRAGLGDEHGEPRQVEAEARIDLVAERGEPLDEERADRLRIADRTRGAGGDALDRAVGAEERKLEAARAVAARRQRRLEPRREPLDGGEHVLLARDRLVEALLGEIRRNRQARAERLVLAAERAVELAQEIGAEAGGERRARQIEDVADALQAEARQCGDHVTRESQRHERQRRQEIAFVAGSCDRRLAETRRGPSRADGRGDCGARGKAEARHPCEQIVAQPLLAAEEMRAAADVEQDAVGRIDRDERRVALAPVGDGVEQARVGRLVLRHGGERGMHGAGLRQRHAGDEAALLRGGIDRDQEVEVAALAEDSERRRSLTRSPRDAVGRKPLQPQAEYALRTRSAAPHCSTPRSRLRDDHGGCAPDARRSAAGRCLRATRR